MLENELALSYALFFTGSSLKSRGQIRLEVSVKLDTHHRSGSLRLPLGTQSLKSTKKRTSLKQKFLRAKGCCGDSWAQAQKI